MQKLIIINKKTKLVVQTEELKLFAFQIKYI